MVGSIDPRCETLRGTHWPAKVAGVFGTRVAENHLGQRSPAASTGRTYGCKRSDQTSKNSCGTGAVHIWVPACAGTTTIVLAAHCARVLQSPSAPLIAQGKPGADCTCCLVCQTHSNRRTRAYRFSRNSPAFPRAMVLRLTSCSPR